MAGGADVRRIYRTVWAWCIGANLAVVLSFFFGAAAWAAALFPTVDTGDLLALIAAVSSAYFVFGATWVYRSIRRWTIAASEWVVEGRPATDDERSALSAIPQRTGAVCAAIWIFGVPIGVVTLTYGVDFPLTAATMTKAMVAWGMLGFAASILSYLLTERGLRHVRAAALAGGWLPPGPGAMGMRARLTLAWTGAAALPLVTIGIFFLGTTSEQRARSVTVVWYTIVVGLIAGLIVTLFAAHTIITPILRVRRGMQAVAEGNLDEHIDVDEASELGLLQSGFNQMVEGLRERERMRDIFGRHVGTEVAKHALETDFGLGGERCEATTMFVDVIGSTSMAVRESPDAVVAFLNTFFDEVVSAVAFEGGYVNQFQGDGAVCVFGLPSRPEDHAERALRAARALRDGLATRGIGAALGVSSGEVVAGNVGTADRYGFTVIGDPVNEAARLTDEAKLRPSRVLASRSTIDRARSREAVCWTEVGPIGLRGRDRATVAYEPS